MPRTTSTVLAAIATAALGAAVLAPVAAQAATPYKATIKTSTARTNVGSAVTVTGKITGGPVKGKKVTIYSANASKDNSPFQKEKVVSLTSTATYSAKIRMTDGGNRLFRVVKGADGGHASVKTTSGAVKVFRIAGGNEFASRKIDGTSVNGTTSRGGWEIWTNNAVGFELSQHDCISWEATVGVDTDSVDSTVDGAFTYPLFNFFFTATKGLDPVKLSSKIAPGADFGVFANTAETSKLALTKIDFKCNTPYDF